MRISLLSPGSSLTIAESMWRSSNNCCAPEPWSLPSLPVPARKVVALSEREVVEPPLPGKPAGRHAPRLLDPSPTVRCPVRRTGATAAVRPS